uniref:Uncharacterized protein n=1 Tax=Pithovirus LCDPAC02 TaxID=2506601 RepID=A0A481YQI7_9VIRU|nr:MAG: hypothetical protein LCDPAC02_03760 [Pithovirus LCDPAC02]
MDLIILKNCIDDLYNQVQIKQEISRSIRIVDNKKLIKYNYPVDYFLSTLGVDDMRLKIDNMRSEINNTRFNIDSKNSSEWVSVDSEELHESYLIFMQELKDNGIEMITF